MNIIIALVLIKKMLYFAIISIVFPVTDSLLCQSPLYLQKVCFFLGLYIELAQLHLAVMNCLQMSFKFAILHFDL